MSGVWVATYHSRHFAFEAYGATEADAWSAMTRTLCRHHDTTDATDDWLAEAVKDMTVVERALGCGYRDGEPLGAHG